MSRPIFAIIAGTGVYKIHGLTDITHVVVNTPFGPTSESITLGTCHGMRCAFLARHRADHSITPSEVPYKANIWALKSLGVKYLLSVSACGSLKEEYKPLDLVLVHQFIDRTKARDSTFCGNGFVAHVSFGNPTCKQMRELVLTAINSVLPAVKVHSGGTYVCMEGPCFSTRAESLMYRQWGGDVIGMTALTEAKLAREAELAFACVGLVTDYDAWREHEESVNASSVMEVLKINGGNVQVFVPEIIKLLSSHLFESVDHSALQYAIITNPKGLEENRRKELLPLISKYL
jgi:5'-methylthioadenosine phosphorylase